MPHRPQTVNRGFPVSELRSAATRLLVIEEPHQRAEAHPPGRDHSNDQKLVVEHQIGQRLQLSCA